LLTRLGGETVSVDRFITFLSQKVVKKIDPDHLRVIADRIDMNGDGKIDLEDLETSLKLKSYAGFTSKTPYPTKPLPPDSGRAVVRAVRNAMVAKRLNYYDAFRQFDSNGNGMLSYKELCDGLDTVIQLSQDAKDGLFSIMDK
jgi:Ca2+-binding EF-hand superfamily protein